MGSGGGRRGKRRITQEKEPDWTRAPQGPVPGHEEESSGLHEERLEAVIRELRRTGVASVLDLGCGSGSLLRSLAPDERFSHISGVDSSITALQRARCLLDADGNARAARVRLVHGSILEPTPDWAGFDAVTLVETIEHIPPGDLSRLELAVFRSARPSLVVITTPNREYNVLLGLAAGDLRHADHRFEWDRPRFESWARGLADRHGYSVFVTAIGPRDEEHGSPTQMASFHRLGEPT
jgi:small RNA 2'-O-methyltransferase